MKMNPEKWHVIISGDTNIPEDFTIQINNVHRAPESDVTLLGITLDSKFDSVIAISLRYVKRLQKDWMHFAEYPSI